MEQVLTTPISEQVVRSLHVGDVIYITGTMFTARDAAHLMMLERGAPFPVDGLVLYHCGPVVKKNGTQWRVVSAGPTTSARMDPFENEFLERFPVRMIVGKGGMGKETLLALQKVGAVYAHYTGGAGALAGQAIGRVIDVHWLTELGIPEAMWVFAVERFGPLVVTMDSHGNSLYDRLEAQVKQNLIRIHARIDKGERWTNSTSARRR